MLNNHPRQLKCRCYQLLHFLERMRATVTSNIWSKMEIWKQSTCINNTDIVSHSQVERKETIGPGVMMFKGFHELVTPSQAPTQVLRAHVTQCAMTYGEFFLTKPSLVLKTHLAISSDLLSQIPSSRNVPGPIPFLYKSGFGDPS